MRRRDFIAGPIADALGPQDISSGRPTAISMGMEGTFRLREAFSTSFNALRRHVVAFVILSAIAHIPSLSLSLWEFTWVRDARVLLRWMVLVDQLTFVVGFVCVLIAYGAIMHGVVEDLAGRRVSIAEAVAIAARRLLPLVGVSAAALLLSRLGMGLLSPAFIVLSTYWLVTWMFFMVAPICIAKRVGVGAALSRCLFLTRGTPLANSRHHLASWHGQPRD